MIKVKLTGKRRHRIEKRMFRHPLMVLQVEVHETGTTTMLLGGSIDIIDINAKYYRDARAEDLTVE